MIELFVLVALFVVFYLYLFVICLLLLYLVCRLVAVGWLFDCVIVLFFFDDESVSFWILLNLVDCVIV